MPKKRKTEEVTCIFCGRSNKNCDKTFRTIKSGVENYGVCFDCLRKCTQLANQYCGVGSDFDVNDFIKSLSSIKPVDIKKHLDDFIIGQDKAKIALSVAIYNHYKKLRHNLITNDVNDKLDKSNILMIGNSGSGKTLLAKNIAKILDVPFCICDATTYTEAGYVGEDVENAVLKLVQAANYDVKKAETGIIYIDEIDKLAKRNPGQNTTRDVAGEGVQQSFLKIIEGSVINVPPKGGRKHPESEYLHVDTSNILFIFGGAFVGLKEAKERKLSNNGHVGFDSISLDKTEIKNSDLKYTSDDIIEYGFIPEFVGRIPITISMDALTEEDFARILVEPKDSIISQFKKLMKADGIDLDFTDEALKRIAKIAFESKTGARALRSIIEDVMMKFMYETPSKKIKKLLITVEDVDAAFTSQLKKEAI